ncbi:MAG: PfkB family carbohydrate kinase [Sedimentisphaerales bacterium]
MNMANYIDVLGLGSVTVDFVGTIDKWPAEGSKQPLESFSIHDGGLVGTALVAVSRLGGRAAFAGKLGNSDMAKRAISAFKKDEVDTSLVSATLDAEPVVAFVFTNSLTGHRNIFWTRQGVQYPMPSELPDTHWYEKTRVLLIDYECGLAGIAAAKIAGKHKIPVVSDIEGKTQHTADAMAVSTHLVVSEDFAQTYTAKANINDMLQTLRTFDDQTVIITRGVDGCAGIGPEGHFTLPAYKVNAIDTNGCGDTFHGAFALAIARKMKIIEATKFASAAAALCATKIGGRDGIPNAKQLETFMKNNQLK